MTRLGWGEGMQREREGGDLGKDKESGQKRKEGGIRDQEKAPLIERN